MILKIDVMHDVSGRIRRSAGDLTDAAQAQSSAISAVGNVPAGFACGAAGAQVADAWLSNVAQCAAALNQAAIRVSMAANNFTTVDLGNSDSLTSLIP